MVELNGLSRNLMHGAQICYSLGIESGPSTQASCKLNAYTIRFQTLKILDKISSRLGFISLTCRIWFVSCLFLWTKSFRFVNVCIRRKSKRHRPACMRTTTMLFDLSKWWVPPLCMCCHPMLCHLLQPSTGYQYNSGPGPHLEFQAEMVFGCVYGLQPTLASRPAFHFHVDCRPFNDKKVKRRIRFPSKGELKIYKEKNNLINSLLHSNFHMKNNIWILLIA